VLRRAKPISVGATARGGYARLSEPQHLFAPATGDQVEAPVGAVRQVGPSPPAKTASPDSGEWPSRLRLRSRKMSPTRDGVPTHRPRMRGEEPKNREAKQYFDHCWLVQRTKRIELLCRSEKVKQFGRTHHRSEGDCPYENEAENRYQRGLEEPHA